MKPFASILILGCLVVCWPAFADDPYLADGPYAPDKRTVVLYHFNEAAGVSLPQDSSLYGNHPYAGPLATGDVGVFGNAMAFTNSYIEISHDASFLSVQSNGFLECWIKPSEDYLNRWGGNDVLIGKNAGGNNRGDVNFGMRMNPIANGGGQFYLTAETGAGTFRTLQTSNMIKESRWYHVRVEWDSVNTPTFRVDGIEKALTDPTSNTNFDYVGPYFNVNVRLLIGCNGPVGHVLLDELRIGERSPPPGTVMVLR